LKAVIYARYSSDSQREESIDGQLRECTAFAEKNGITVLRHYVDRAFSAKTDNRPEFQNMIKESIIAHTERIFYVCCSRAIDNLAIYCPSPTSQVILQEKMLFGDANVLSL
jgi:DNA invertase Pin-like site-specific DNA recombinase